MTVLPPALRRLVQLLTLAPALLALVITSGPLLQALEGSPRELEELFGELETSDAEGETDADGDPPDDAPPAVLVVRRATANPVRVALPGAPGFSSPSRPRVDEATYRIGHPRGPPRA